MTFLHLAMTSLQGFFSLHKCMTPYEYLWLHVTKLSEESELATPLKHVFDIYLS